jgi:haloalkane dehalogenase
MKPAANVFLEFARDTFRGFRSPAGEDMVLRDNVFVEQVLPSAMRRRLTDTEMDHYRNPFVNADEDRRRTGFAKFDRRGAGRCSENC